MLSCQAAGVPLYALLSCWQDHRGTANRYRSEDVAVGCEHSTRLCSINHGLVLCCLQSKAVQQHIKASGIQVDVVVVSPLKRALQTAVGCFGNHSGKPCNGTPPLMMECIAQQGKVTAHPVVSAEGCPPVVCYELCREHLGVHPCDRRSWTSELAAEYPAVDFSLLSDEEDVLWQLQHRETKEEIMARGLAFMAQIMARPEKNIAVVSHSSFLHFMMANYGGQASTAVQGELHRWFENCELRSIVVADDQADSHGRDPQDFHGFPAAGAVEGPLV
eukprot:GHRQ01012481.1.p1 GENE.GHRQ01012481.1~~GHRQ01012481.1.p1  ORF type:complete len:275 (+),score=88.04 GHRQ01012481.1:108-932(+)